MNIAQSWKESFKTFLPSCFKYFFLAVISTFIHNLPKFLVYLSPIIVINLILSLPLPKWWLLTEIALSRSTKHLLSIGLVFFIILIVGMFVIIANSYKKNIKVSWSAFIFTVILFYILERIDAFFGIRAFSVLILFPVVTSIIFFVLDETFNRSIRDLFYNLFRGIVFCVHFYPFYLITILVLAFIVDYFYSPLTNMMFSTVESEALRVFMNVLLVSVDFLGIFFILNWCYVFYRRYVHGIEYKTY